MNVLTRTNRPLTVEECYDVQAFVALIKTFGDGGDLPDQPDIIQEWYSEWLRDDHHPLSPVNNDDADDLWLKFCEEVGR